MYSWAGGSSGHFQLLIPRPARQEDRGVGDSAAAVVGMCTRVSRLLLVYCSKVGRFGTIDGGTTPPGNGLFVAIANLKRGARGSPPADGLLAVGDGLSGAAADRKAPEEKEDAAARAKV